MNNKIILNYFSLTDNEIVDYKLTEEDINNSILPISKALGKEGYIKPTNEEFSHLVDSIFGINMSNIKQCNQILAHNRFFTYVLANYDNVYTEKQDESQSNLDKRIKYNKEWEFDKNDKNGNVIFANSENYIFLPLTPDQFGKVENGVFKIELPDYIIYRNKYLFNNNKASLTWLIKNDILFLQELVTVFGYDKDPRINEAVLKKIAGSTPQFKANLNLLDVFAKKDCFGKLDMREDLMKYIYETTTVDDNLSMNILENYAYALGDDENGNYIDLYESFTESEKYRIITYSIYYAELSRTKNNIDDLIREKGLVENWRSNSALFNLLNLNPKLIEEIKKNSFYDLPNLKEMIENILKSN